MNRQIPPLQKCFFFDSATFWIFTLTTKKHDSPFCLKSVIAKITSTHLLQGDLLIGKHVQSSYELRKAAITLLATGYILIDGGVQSSVQYVSNTNPIPKDKYNIAAATALAGEQLGLQFIYIDAGSGALFPISKKMIQTIKRHISIPLIVGGGIKNYKDLENAWIAGADIVVIGNAIEKNKDLIQSLNKRMKCN